MSISDTTDTFDPDTGDDDSDGVKGIQFDAALFHSPFADYAHPWRAAGWLGVIPLPSKAKNPPPNRYTGKTNRILYASDSQVRAWIESGTYNEGTRNPQTVGNVGLALGWPVDVDGEPMQVVGVDVDDYESHGKTKCGGSQLKRLESELGELPATYISSARTDGVSGIRFLLAPADAEFRGQADRDIEIIQRKHRYAVVWPSAYPPDGETGKLPAGVSADGRYHLYPPGAAPDGVSFCEAIPDVTELGRLPDSWVRYLQDANGTASRPFDSESSPSELSDWATETFNAGDEASACAEIRRNVAYWRAEITREATSHDKITRAHWQIVRAAAEGHTGWHWALEEIKAAYVGDVTDRNKRGYGELRDEIFRSLTNALRKTKAAPGSQHVNPQCVCALGTVPGFQTVGSGRFGYRRPVFGYRAPRFGYGKGR
ncbi:bifunctional DNA primase/polymerase [Mycolicibacterium sp.]|uniref:bifunctional DNA primase/polymerase n=1 Tax=Mycolicibacterium sp. TaxID=2320850 RepID=UPI00355F9358